MKRYVRILFSLTLALVMTLSLASAAPAADAPVIVIYQNSGAGNGAGSEAGSTKAGYEMVQNYIYEQTGVWVEAIKAPSTNAEEKLNMMRGSGADRPVLGRLARLLRHRHDSSLE